MRERSKLLEPSQEAANPPETLWTTIRPTVHPPSAIVAQVLVEMCLREGHKISRRWIVERAEALASAGGTKEWELIGEGDD